MRQRRMLPLITGVSLEGHAGRKLTAEMARNYDLILAMESEHIAQVTAITPGSAGRQC